MLVETVSIVMPYLDRDRALVVNLNRHVDSLIDLASTKVEIREVRERDGLRAVVTGDRPCRAAPVARSSGLHKHTRECSLSHLTLRGIAIERHYNDYARHLSSYPCDGRGEGGRDVSGTPVETGSS